MSETHQLLREIEAFIGDADMAPSTFGRKAVNDGKLVGRLRAGSTVTLENASRIRRFIKANTKPVPDRALPQVASAHA
jgi:hypothetical protein